MKRNAKDSSGEQNIEVTSVTDYVRAHLENRGMLKTIEVPYNPERVIKDRMWYGQVWRKDIFSDTMLKYVVGYWKLCNIGVQRMYARADLPLGPRSSQKLYLPLATALKCTYASSELDPIYPSGMLDPIASLNLGFFPAWKHRGGEAIVSDLGTMTLIDIPVKKEAFQPLALKLGLNCLIDGDALLITERNHLLVYRFIERASVDGSEREVNGFFNNGVINVFGSPHGSAIVPSIYTKGDEKELSFLERARMLTNFLRDVAVERAQLFIFSPSQMGVD